MSNISKEIDSLFKEWDRPDSPGCVLGVIRNGKMIYERGYGMASLEHKVPITSNSVFCIGSVSKQFTAMCIAILSEENQLSLDDGIRKYVPELPEYADQITIRHLIHHTSGIRDYTFLFTNAMLTTDMRIFDNITKDDVLKMLVRQKKLIFNPGDRYDYSNSNYFLLGVIVERVTGKSLRVFADESIFKPLGMINTHYHDDSKMVVPNRAYGYAPKDENGCELSISNCEVVGDGCVFTTIRDLLLLDSNFYNNQLPGESKLISTIETSGKLNNGELHSYAFGLFRSEYRGLLRIYHGGGWVGFVAYMGRFPEHKFTVIILGNHSSFPAQQFATKVVDIYLKQYLEKQEQEQTPKEVKLEEADVIPAKIIDELVGFHKTPGGSLLEVSKIESNLSLQIVGMNDTRTTYRQVSKDRFQPVGGYIKNTLEIERIENQNAYRLVSPSQDGSRSIWKQLKEEITASEIADYNGHYYSREFDAMLSIRQSDDGILMCRANTSWSSEYKLCKVQEDELIFSMAQIRFRRNNQRVVIGFDFHSKYGIQDIRFRRRKQKERVGN